MSIRFAILGAGRIGQVHARAVNGNDQAVLAAVFDPVEAAAASVAEQYGAEIRDLDAIAAADDTVLVEFWLSGTHLGDLKANGRVFPPTGRKFRVRMAATFEFAPNSDKIICERPYSATDAKLRALGLL